MPSGWPSPQAMSAPELPQSPGGVSRASATGLTTPMTRAPWAWAQSVRAIDLLQHAEEIGLGDDQGGKARGACGRLGLFHRGLAAAAVEGRPRPVRSPAVDDAAHDSAGRPGAGRAGPAPGGTWPCGWRAPPSAPPPPAPRPRRRARRWRRPARSGPSSSTGTRRAAAGCPGSPPPGRGCRRCRTRRARRSARPPPGCGGHRPRRR